MHKRWLGISSFVMAGLLTVTNVGTGVTQVFAAEAATGSSLVAEVEEAAVEASSAETSVEDAADEASSEASVAEEATEESSDESAKEATDEASAETSAEPAEEENSLVFFNRWNQSAKTSGKLVFSKQYEEYCYDLGETVPVANVKALTVKVSKQDKNVAIKLYDADMNEKYVNYGCDKNSEYVFNPTYDGNVRYIGVMSMASGEAEYPYGITIDAVVVDKQEAEAPKNEETIVLEGDALKFTEAWEGTEVDGATLEFDKEWREYRVSLGKTIPGPDVKSVKVTFAEANKQSICIKTYGGGTELKADYGKNGSNSYTTYPNVTADVDAIAIMAMNEQTYPFSVTVEKIEVVVDTTPAEERPQAGVEYDIVDLRKPVAELMGDDFIIGTAASYDEFGDPLDMELVYKHFNGVTLGNELKPDSMLRKDAEIVDYELNGEMVPFPVLDFSRPEDRLDRFVKWNEEHPEKKIQIRGHVLVWHSQTPSFFFHEDYDTSKPYVTPDVMNKRLEIYIREVAKHFTAEDSKYKDLFYGWDVVNEAVSDGTGTYRNASERSEWWGVYNSQEFITNAFVYANRYMPADIALFYNDYNETVSSKMGGICQLLRDVKATPGARIDGMGMQAHYQIASNNPSMEQFKTAAKAYAAIVDQVQVTELDFKGATSAKDDRLAERYKAVYDTIRRLREDGVNFTGMTIWGVTDKHSWLQSSNNNGGGADGSARQYPLLFDDYYKAKDCFWAIANAGELEPEVKSITLVQNVNNDFSAGNVYEFVAGKFIPMWSENGIDVKVVIKDTTTGQDDFFTVYADDGTGIKSVVVKREEATENENGYEAVVNVPVDFEALTANKVKFDIVVNDGDSLAAFNDTTFKHAQSSKFFAETVIKPLAVVKKGTPVIDGEFDDAAWKTADELPVAINVGAKASASAKILWDDEYLYVLADVKDPVLNKAASDAWEQDSVEIFVDENNNKTSTYEADDKQYRIGYENTHSFNGTKCVEENIKSEVVVTEDGYKIEAALKWTDIAPAEGAKVGLDIQVNDADNSGKRVGTLNWADKTGNGWSSTEVFGTILLAAGEETPEVPEGTLVTKYGKTYYVSPEGVKLVGIHEIDGKTYYFDGNKDGAMKKSAWITVDGKKYYAKADGSFAKEELAHIYKSDYIFDGEGVMITGLTSFDGNMYYCKPDGKVSKKALITLEDGIYCSGTDGVLARNVKLEMYHNEYIFGDDCKAQTGLVTYDGQDYYCKNNGRVAKDYMFTVDDKTYYAKNDGTLAKNEQIVKWFRRYTFDENGVLIKTEKGIF